ncbi:MAG: hypothetical protein ABFD54_11390 [Armatimonadota bacterium]
MRIITKITKAGVVLLYQKQVFGLFWRTTLTSGPHAEISSLYKDLGAMLSPCWTDINVVTKSRAARRRTARNWATQVTRSLR